MRTRVHGAPFGSKPATSNNNQIEEHCKERRFSLLVKSKF
jgi:hypothetical protein